MPSLILTHGAGSDRNAPLLIAVGGAFEEAGWAVERANLAYRQNRPSGPPRRGDAEKDREGLRAAAASQRPEATGRLVLGGVSYGGRQSSILVAGQPDLVDGLLLLSYPLHPPGKAAQLRTEHFPRIQTPCLFVHGTKDPFGSIDELAAAIRAIPAPTELIVIDGAGHDLKRGKGWSQSALVDKLNALCGR